MFFKSAVGAILALGLVLFSSPVQAAESQKPQILVSAAVSLKNAFEEIGALYQMRTKVRAQLNLGASGLLQKQIEAGAPVDVFASAGTSQMDALQKQGMIIEETRRNFARNTLVLVVPAQSRLLIRSFSDLSNPRIAEMAIGNPKTVPAGQYARETLESLKLWDRLQPKLVLAENVRQVLDYVERGETEAGIVYASDVAVAGKKVEVAARAPDETHSPILYPVAIVKETLNRGSAQRFINMILSNEGQEILHRHGFAGIQ
jgi:molybdate transport system substrate-binding protein